MGHTSHQRDTDARTLPRVPRYALIAAPLATLLTAGVVTAGVVAGSPQAPASPRTPVAGAPLTASIDEAIAERAEVVSRSASRSMQVVESGPKLAIDQARLRRIAERKARKATRAAIAGADTRLWVTTNLNLWTAAAGGTNRGLLREGKRVLITGRKASGRTEVVLDGASRWVTSGYLSSEKPKPEPTASAGSGSSSPSLGGACTNGSAVSGGANVIKVHQAVCAAFPSITSYGTYRGDGEHAQGIAIDIMVSGGTGWDVAEFLRANRSALGISYIIYSQKIWSVQRSGEGWRSMSDRGSVTANHYDHVHVTTY